MQCRFSGNARQHVIFDLVFLEKFETPHHLLEGPVAFTVFAIAVMDLSRAVQAYTHHKIVRPEKGTPFIGEQRAVGLQAICDCFAVHERLLEQDDFFKKIKAEQGRLPALPDEFNNRRGLGGDVFGDISSEALHRTYGTSHRGRTRPAFRDKSSTRS